LKIFAADFHPALVEDLVWLANKRKLFPFCVKVVQQGLGTHW
jgi:hypothetical protein